MPTLFIAGTDTGVGKTVVTGLLAAYLQRLGHSVVTQKWVQTGCDEDNEDVRVHWRLMKRKAVEFSDSIEDISPYQFTLPSSPHLAAREEGVEIDASRIKSALHRLQERFEWVLVEGAGGLMVPLTEDRLLIDVVAEIKVPVVLVAQDRVGVINHTLLSMESIAQRQLPLNGVVLTSVEREGPSHVIASENQRYLERALDRFCAGRRVVRVPFLNFSRDLESQFASDALGELLFASY